MLCILYVMGSQVQPKEVQENKDLDSQALATVATWENPRMVGEQKT
jgi:hypothetical protein